MDKKTLPLIILLVIVVVFYFQIMEFLGFYTPASPTQRQESSQQASPDLQTSPDSTPTLSLENSGQRDLLQSPQSQMKFERADIVSQTQALDSLVSDTLVINTEKYKILMTSLGGGPVSIKLLEYEYRDGGEIEMIPDANRSTPDVQFSGGAVSTSLMPFVCDRSPGQYNVTGGDFRVEYRLTGQQGGTLVKKYIFYADRYHYDLVITLEQGQQLGFERNYRLVWNTPLGITEPQLEQDYTAMEAVAMQSGSRENMNDFDDGRLNQSLEGSTSWVGLRSRYFAAVLIPQNREGDLALASGTKDKISSPEGRIERTRIVAGMKLDLESGSTVNDSFSVFVGPLDYTLMSEYNVGLEDMLDIGTTPFVGWIIKPFAMAIIWLLPRMYDVIPNYGLVIILFALLIKIVTLPLSMKSFKSMAAMKELQPKMEALKQKHKKNPQALNKETMKMYKAHGVNPMSGCLPMLPQMPLFFALFSVFRSTILLRNAPFTLFIDDLSRGASGFTDPYILLVLVMIGAQFISQRFTMTSTQQNKALMYVMPVFMGFLFYRLAAGLILYWTCFSAFSMLDYLIFRHRKNQEVKTT